MTGQPRLRATFHDVPLLRRGILSLFTLTSVLLLPNIAAAQTAAPNTLSPEEIDDGWILLFDGADRLRLEGRQRGQLEGGRRRDLGERGRERAAVHDQRVRRLRAEGRFPRAGRNQQRHLPAHARRADRSGRRLLRAEHRRAVGQPVSHRQLRRPPEGRGHARHRPSGTPSRSRPRAAISPSRSTASSVLDYVDQRPIGPRPHRPAVQLRARSSFATSSSSRWACETSSTAAT